MPRVIFKCPHIKGGTALHAVHRKNYVGYIATREGVERIRQGGGLPATQKQRDVMAQILREFPLCRGMFEYEDYQAAPTRENASEFIRRALEDNLDRAVKKENYLKYIAMRPNVQKLGGHGLFSDSPGPLTLSQAAEAVAHHPGTVWLPIISLRREDAARLGYDSAERWKTLLTAQAAQIAEAMKIPLEQFRWYAAFHDQAHHPHVHMVCYSADGRSGFLTRQGIAKIKSDLAKEIFQHDLIEIYTRQTHRRDALTQEAGALIRALANQMQAGVLENERIEMLLLELSRRLKTLSGKKQYGYLKAPSKALVDEIVDELAKDSRISEAYDLWYEMREEVLRTYRDEIPERVPLSQQKAFKSIKNVIIKEALQLSVEEKFDGTVVARSTANLLRHMSNMFQEQAAPTAGAISFTDSKLRRKIQEKKIAMGHKPDDHEETMTLR